ncbi:MAG: hypothetical protein R3206_03305 [Salegentibacter mishustinae]|nr:hypothetical protein [Salegentibacter mishustinae]
MKKTFILLFITVFAVISFISCSSVLQNRITFHNDASNSISVNFRGEKYDIAPGQKVNLVIHHEGTYSYATAYELPAGTTSSTAEGDVSGDILVKAGSKVLVYYVSSFIEGVYTISAIKTTSDDLTVEEDPNPIGP